MDSNKQQNTGMGTGRGMGGGKGQRGTGGGAGGPCVCTGCGHTVDHKRGIPCQQEQCPKCGKPMMRKR